MRALTTIRLSLVRSAHFWLTTLQRRTDILNSQYHQQGVPDFRVRTELELELGSRLAKIQNLQSELESRRQAAEGGLRDEEDPAVKEYLRVYSQLVDSVRGCPLNSEWVYRTIAWYNMRPLFKPLLVRLLRASQLKEIRPIVEALSQMSYKWGNERGEMDSDLTEGRQVQEFYRKLPTDISIRELQKIEGLLKTSLTLTKRKFYEAFNRKTLERRLRSTTFEDREQLGEIVWLLEATVNSMNDQEFLLGKIEMYLLTSKAKLEPEHVESLIRTYTLKGRINPNIYKHVIKPHLLKHRMGKMRQLIDTVRFVVCSECDDQPLLKNLYELIDNQYKPGAIEHSESYYVLHLYTHYLRTKGYQIKLRPRLELELNNFCKQRSEGRNSLNAAIFRSRETNDAVVKSRSKYISPCLDVKPHPFSEFEASRRSDFEQHFKSQLLQLDLPNMEVIEKPMVCCFELDYCLREAKSRGKRELIDVEVQGIQYVFASGRLSREHEIRDEILQHYGIRVVHVNYNNVISYGKLTEDVLLNVKVTRPFSS